MGWLERMDRRNQAIVEEQNRAFNAGEVGATGIVGAAGAYGLGKLAIWLMPWSPTTEMMVLVAVAVALLVGGFFVRRARRRARQTDA